MVAHRRAAALALALALAATLALAARRRRRCHLAVRRELPTGARRVRVSRGHCLARIDGNGNGGRLVVLVHGFVGCHLDLEPLSDQLVRLGRRVLRLDNFGRGWSDLPRGQPHLPALFAGQIAEALFALGETGPIDLVGYSMGGAIAAAFAETFGTARVASVTLLATAGLPAMARCISPATQRLARAVDALPGGRVLLLLLASRLIASAADESPTAGGAQLQTWYAQMMRRRVAEEPELPHAIVETVCAFPFAGLAQAFRALAQARVPTLAVWAADDATIPSDCAGELRAIFAAEGAPLRELCVEGVGHMVALERAKEVADEMERFWHLDLISSTESSSVLDST